MGTKEGDQNSFAFSSHIRLATIKHAMIDHFTSPPNPFNDVIRKVIILFYFILFFIYLFIILNWINFFFFSKKKKKLAFSFKERCY